MKKPLSQAQVLARAIEERARFYLGKDGERFTVCIVVIDHGDGTRTLGPEYVLSTPSEEGLFVLSSFLQAKGKQAEMKIRKRPRRKDSR